MFLTEGLFSGFERPLRGSSYPGEEERHDDEPDHIVAEGSKGLAEGESLSEDGERDC